MNLRFIGTTSQIGDCPTLYEIEETGDVLVQGEKVTDPEHLAKLRDVKDSEAFVIVPRALLTRFAPRAAAAPMIPFAEAAHFFSDFQHTAWRLETRMGYDSDCKSEKWQRFLAGEDVASVPGHPWYDNVKAQTAQGKRFERVRLLDEPVTQGQSFLLASAPGNIAAGEDIRNLTRSEARQLGLPDYDFWLFDSRTVVRFVFDENDVTLGVVVSEDPAEVAAACQARDAAWHHARRIAPIDRQVRSAV